MKKRNWKKGDRVGFVSSDKISVVHEVRGSTIVLKNSDGTKEEVKGSSSYLIKKRSK